MILSGNILRIVVLAAAFVIAGCAGDASRDGAAPAAPAASYEEAKRLLAQGQVEDGLKMLEQVARENPRDQKLRFEWMRLREGYVGQFVAQGDALRRELKFDDAAAAYQRALRLDGNDARAKAGLEGIHVDRRHAAAVRDAEALLAKKNYAGAEALLRPVLAADPAHREARNLMRRVADAQASQRLALPILKGAFGKQVTLEFREANLRSVFDVIARTTGLNFVFDRDVRPELKTTIVVRNSSVDDVIKLILVTNQLARKVLNDNTILVYPNTPAKQKEYQELVVRSFYIANVDAKQVLNLVRSVVKTRDLFVDEKLNLLVMKDTPEAVRLAEKLIAAQDLAEPEVVLEVEVLEVASSRLRDLGVDFPDQIRFQDPSTVPAPGVGGTVTALTSLQRASGGLTGYVATPALVVNLKQTDGTTNVLANPRIRVKNREKAKVHIGERVPVVTTTTAPNVGTASSVAYLDVGLKLDVEPNIHLEGDVAIKVGLEVSNIIREVPTTGGGLAYQVGTRNAATLLRLKDGETQILAGLIQDDERNTANKLPGFGDLPLLGRLFSTNSENRVKTEIVLLITPRVVRALNRPDSVIAEYFSGTETAIGAEPLRIAATRPGALAVSAGGGGRGAGAPSRSASPPAAGRVLAKAPPVQPARVAASVPSRVSVGKEFEVVLSLVVHAAATEADMEIAYDSKLLAPEGTEAAEGAAGRITVKLDRAAPGGAVQKLKFRVIAEAPGQTQLRFEKLAVRDAAGEAVSAKPPPPSSVEIVQ